VIFPDIEVALCDYLGDLGYCVTSTPIDMEDHLPVLRITRVGGEDDFYNGWDHPNVVIQVFVAKNHADARDGFDLCESIRDRMNEVNDGGLYLASANALIAESHTISGPVELPYINPAISVFQCGHRITTKGR